MARTSNTRQSGYAGGTPGGTTAGAGAVGNAPRKYVGRAQMLLGDEVYLWVLVLIEAGIVGWLRQTFARYHGG